MAKFFVGQRVRMISKSERATCKTPVGAEGRVSSVGPFKAGELSWDGLPFNGDRDLTVTWDTGEDAAHMACRIAPIQPSGAAPSEYTYTELMDRLKAGEVERV